MRAENGGIGGRVPGESANAVDAGAVAAAHAQLLAKGNVQLDLPAYAPPKLPDWLQPLLDFLARSGPIVKLLFYAGLAFAVLLLVLTLWRWLAPLYRRWRDRSPGETPAEQWQPDAAPARALLAEADALAAAGAFAEAAHLLLLRSVEQIEARFPGQVRPSWTSRDIARVPILPPDAARAFGFIAGVVETGLFGRRPVSADAWQRCRDAYATAAFGSARA
jgi:hypothetical protein